MTHVKIFSVVLQVQGKIVQEIVRFFVVVGFGTEISEENGQGNDLQWLSEKNRGEKSTNNRYEPLLSLVIAEFDATGNNEKNGTRDENDAQTVCDEDAPPWEHRRCFLLSFNWRWWLWFDLLQGLT